MTTQTSITVDLRAMEELESHWEELAAVSRRDPEAATKIATEAAQLLVGAIREAVLDSAKQSTRGFSVRTGALARSFREEIKVRNGVLSIGAFSRLVYAQIQDRGGVIVPRRMKSLAIPLTRKAAIRWPRDWPRGKLFRPHGKDWLGSTKGKKGIEVQYLLRKSVRLKGKGYLKVAGDKAIPEIARLFVKRMTERVATQ